MKTSKKSAVFLTDALKKNFIFPLGIIVCIVFSALLSSVMPIFFQRVIDNLALGISGSCALCGDYHDHSRHMFIAGYRENKALFYADQQSGKGNA